MNKPRPMKVHNWNSETSCVIVPYEQSPRPFGGIAVIPALNLYPDDARKLAKWLIQYADWHDAKDAKT